MSNNSDTTALNFLRTTIQRKILTEKGIKVENFTQKMVNGKTFDLYSVKNKFILLEFWSSSCAPCRANNPNWKKIYAEYHQKGLEIVGISLDSNLSDWKNAIKNDGLPWINVSDLLGFNNIVAQNFLIDFIPLNILLDEKYSIISFNISPSDLGDMINKSISK
jgi:thiol-disulfide isomerase/thioredoxin